MQDLSTRLTRTTSKTSALVASLLVWLSGASSAQPDPPATEMIHVGFSSTMFAGINRTDARNSIKAVTASLAREFNVPTESEPLIYENVDDARETLRRHLIGAASMTASEYWLLRRNVEFDRFLVGIHNGQPTETYVVLVHDGGGVATLSDLQGKRLTVLSTPAMGLATVWLDVELAKKKLPPTAAFLGGVAEFPRPAKVVLPVFFGQADACLVNRRAYHTIVELNPQVGRQLRVLAASPAFIPALIGFRSDLSPTLKEKTIVAFATLHNSIAGQQTLAIFLSDEIAERPASAFDSSLALIDEHARLCPEANAALVATLHGQRSAPQQVP